MGGHTDMVEFQNVAQKHHSNSQMDFHPPLLATVIFFLFHPTCERYADVAETNKKNFKIKT